MTGSVWSGVCGIFRLDTADGVPIVPQATAYVVQLRGDANVLRAEQQLHNPAARQVEVVAALPLSLAASLRRLVVTDPLRETTDASGRNAGRGARGFDRSVHGAEQSEQDDCVLLRIATLGPRANVQCVFEFDIDLLPHRFGYRLALPCVQGGDDFAPAPPGAGPVARAETWPVTMSLDAALPWPLERVLMGGYDVALHDAALEIGRFRWALSGMSGVASADFELVIQAQTSYDAEAWRSLLDVSYVWLDGDVRTLLLAEPQPLATAHLWRAEMKAARVRLRVMLGPIIKARLERKRTRDAARRESVLWELRRWAAVRAGDDAAASSALGEHDRHDALAAEELLEWRRHAAEATTVMSCLRLVQSKLDEISRTLSLRPG